MLVENCPYPDDVRVRSEAAALSLAGYRVTVIGPRAKGQRLFDLVDGVRVYRFPEPPQGHGFWGYVVEYGYAAAAMFVLSLWAWARQGFDVIHAANPPDLLVFIAGFHKLFGKRFIFDHHDLSPEMYRANWGGEGANRAVHRVLVWLEKLSCRMADHVIATNESYKRMEMERDGIPKHRITVVRNGPDVHRFRPAEPDPTLRPEGKTVLAYVGTIDPHDGVDHLLRALHHLVYDIGRKDVCCWVIGGRGRATEPMKAMTADLRLDDYVQFTGWISDRDMLRRLLASVDICVDPAPWNPYNDRSTMIKIAEYMAMGKPIVAFDLKETRYTAQEAAAYVPGNDEMAFARTLVELMDDPLRRKIMSAFGRRRVEAELSWSRSAANLLSVYRSLLPACEPESTQLEDSVTTK